MKILIICSTSFYDKIKTIKEQLVSLGHVLIMPNNYDTPVTNEDHESKTEEEYVSFFQEMYLESRNKISEVDAVLVLNYTKEKNGQKLENYIGASTFLEMYEACMQKKKIYVMNDLPNNMLLDEIKGFAPIIINGDLTIIGK